MNEVKYGFKAFDKDLKCRDLQYEVGKIFEESSIEICAKGLHYCQNLKDVYEYYPLDKDTRVCKIIDLSTKTISEGNKSCSDKILILEELTNEYLKEVSNNFTFNSGYGNSGYGNRGNRNSGNRNSGDWNSGYGNSGNRNSGDGNSGNRNSGDGNSGNRNSGDGNSGYGNSGDWNSGNRNSGDLNTTEPTVRLFNKDSKIKFNSEKHQKYKSLINSKWKPHVQWVPESSMTEEEKTNFPTFKTCGGYLKTIPHGLKKSWEGVIKSCTKEEIKFIKSLPNFNKKIFKEITGQDI